MSVLDVVKNLKDDDLLVFALKDVSRNGLVRYFDTYRYDKDNNKFEKITAEVAEATKQQRSNARGDKYNTVMVKGGGMDMASALREYIYEARDKLNGESHPSKSSEYFNGPVTVLNVADKKSAFGKKCAEVVTKLDNFFGYKPTRDELAYLTNASIKESVLKSFDANNKNACSVKVDVNAWKNEDKPNLGTGCRM